VCVDRSSSWDLLVRGYPRSSQQMGTFGPVARMDDLGRAWIQWSAVSEQTEYTGG
jgi:hypothetical protein